MVVTSIVKLFTDAISYIVNMLPTPNVQVLSNIELPGIVKHGAYFFPLDCLVAAIVSFLAWYGLLMSWSVIEWVYKKIPGVD